jgi:hypothetical protein
MENNLCRSARKDGFRMVANNDNVLGTEEQDSGLTPFKLPNQSFYQGVLYFDQPFRDVSIHGVDVS